MPPRLQSSPSYIALRVLTRTESDLDGLLNELVLVVMDEIQPVAELALQLVQKDSAISLNAHGVDSQDCFDKSMLVLDIQRPDHDGIASDPASGG